VSGVASEHGMTRRELARAVVRGALVSIGLVWLAPPAFVIGPLHLPAESAAYAGLLATPAALLEARLGPDVGVVRRLLTASLVGLVGLVAACVAHGQAVYAAGVIEAGALEGGLAAVQAEWVRLQRPIEYVGPRWLLLAGAAGGLSVALACTTVTLPLVAARQDRWSGRVVAIGGASLACAVVIVSVTISGAHQAAAGWTHGWGLVATFVAFASVAPLLLLLGARWASSRIVRDPVASRED
jgi:hypothetical protein